MTVVEVDGPPTPQALVAEARAAYADGEYERSIAAWEQLHDLGRSTGDDGLAAHGAVMVALFLLIETGLLTTVRGWLARAAPHLAVIEEGEPHAIAAMVRCYERFLSGDLQAARTHADDAVRLGTAHDVLLARAFGTVAGARILIAEGQHEAGLSRLDEVGAGLLTGQADPLTTGMVFCELVCAAQNLGAHDRAAEWTELMDTFNRREGLGSTHGRCRVHQAELLRLSGPAARAEEVALTACVELRPWMRREFGWPLVELGDIRYRRGDLAGAEEAYVAAQQHGWPPYAGLARLRLAQGDVSAAQELIDAALTSPVAVPSKEWPPAGVLRLAPLLDAQAEIADAAGDTATLSRAAEALGNLAAGYPTAVIAAQAALARGRERRAAGDLDTAVHACTRAVLAWTEIGATYDAAVARLVLAEVQQAAGRDELALLERQVGAQMLKEYGGQVLPVRRTSPARPESASFGVDAGERVIEFAGGTARVADLVGFRHLARLLVEPGREFHALGLVAVERGDVPAGERAQGCAGTAGAGLPMLDDEARAAYRRRLAEIEEDLAEAEADHDLARIEVAERDREYLVAELRRDVGLADRPRTTGSHAERARTSVTRAVRYAIRRLDSVHPELASHLSNTVHTGTYCRYTPELGSPVVWTVASRQ